jgi:UDP-N-acetylmuramoyl-tripeptide--D-alanyl-D-alanine ligase
MNYFLSDIAATLNQARPTEDKKVRDIVIDSRIVQPGDVFVSIQGEQFDGFNFAKQAIADGAIAVVTDRPLPGASAPVFQVADTRIALGLLAKDYRSRFQGPLVGISGSCGKTSTTAQIASVLSQQGKTLATAGTLNNDLGVPLTLFRLTEQDQYAVIEMGANHLKEIECLCAIAGPQLAVITNSGPVHLEGFGSLEGVRQAKGELYKSLPARGIAIVNADDVGLPYWLTLLSGKQVIQFSTEKPADVYAQNITLDDQLRPTFDLIIGQEQISVHLPVIGVHQVANALAAAAVGFALKLSLSKIKMGLEAAPKVAKRGIMQKGYRDALIIDDSYNANPKALTVAIEMLMAVPNKRKRLLVLGDMAELGSEAVAIEVHKQVGLLAKQSGVDALYSVGKISQAASAGFGVGGHHFADHPSLIQALKEVAQADVCMLIKGSKSSRMGVVVEGLGFLGTL